MGRDRPQRRLSGGDPRARAAVDGRAGAQGAALVGGPLPAHGDRGLGRAALHQGAERGEPGDRGAAVASGRQAGRGRARGGGGGAPEPDVQGCADAGCEAMARSGSEPFPHRLRRERSGARVRSAARVPALPGPGPAQRRGRGGGRRLAPVPRRAADRSSGRRDADGRLVACRVVTAAGRAAHGDDRPHAPLPGTAGADAGACTCGLPDAAGAGRPDGRGGGAVVRRRAAARAVAAALGAGRAARDRGLVGSERRRRAMSGTGFDAIVIGSGLGGLVAAGLAARSGRRVLVLEKNQTCGGAAGVYKAGELTIESSLHELDGLDGEDPKLPVLERLEVPAGVRFVDLGDLWEVRGPALGEPFVMPAGLEAAREATAARFPRRRAAVSEYFDRIARLRSAMSLAVRHQRDPRWWLCEAPRTLWPFVRQQRLSLAHVLERLFGADEAVKQAVCANLIYYADDPGRMWFPHWAVAQGSYHRGGGHYPYGGSKELAEHFVRFIRKAGGEVETGRRVTRILLEGGRVCGVEHVAAGDGDHRCAPGPSATPVRQRRAARAGRDAPRRRSGAVHGAVRRAAPLAVAVDDPARLRPQAAGAGGRALHDRGVPATAARAGARSGAAGGTLERQPAALHLRRLQLGRHRALAGTALPRDAHRSGPDRQLGRSQPPCVRRAAGALHGHDGRRARAGVPTPRWRDRPAPADDRARSGDLPRNASRRDLWLLPRTPPPGGGRPHAHPGALARLCLRRTGRLLGRDPRRQLVREGCIA